MTYKIKWSDFSHWEQSWSPILPEGNLDANGWRFGQKFCNDHFREGFIHTDPGVFYTEDYPAVRRMIIEKYVVDDEEIIRNIRSNPEE